MITKRVFAAAALLTFSAGLAAAAPASVERSTKMRSGPGPKYRVVATLPRGSVIDVGDCAGAWCESSWRGRHGYVVRTSLASARAPAAVGGAPAPSYYDDYPGFDYP